MDRHDNTPELTPLVLLVDDQEWTARSIESVLRPKGHVVLKASTGHQATDLVQKISPDAIIVDAHLPDTDGVDLIRSFRDTSTVYPTTPILVISDQPLGKMRRLEALSAGAWDILHHPVDPSELILRIDTFVRSKQAADRVRDEGLTDPQSGFYNIRGILRRAKEISADATRHKRPLTCVAFGPIAFSDTSTGDTEVQAFAEDVGAPVAEALREVTRHSDMLGKLGPGEYVVVAPGTDQEGALRLADRVLEAIEATGEPANPLAVGAEAVAQIRAGLYAMESGESTTPEDLLLRATMALRRAQADDASFRVRTFEA